MSLTSGDPLRPGKPPSSRQAAPPPAALPGATRRDWIIVAGVLLVAAIIAAAVLSGSSTKRPSSVIERTSTPVTTHTVATHVSTATTAIAADVRSQLRESFGHGALKTSWWSLIGKITESGGVVSVNTRIGDDRDAQGPITAMCGVIGPLDTDIAGVRHVDFYGDDRYGNRVKLGSCFEG